MKAFLISFLLVLACCAQDPFSPFTPQTVTAISVPANLLFTNKTRIVSSGDSHMKGDEIGGKTHPYWFTNRFVTTNLTFVTNAAVGGQLTDTGLNRYMTDVEPWKPSGGTNAIDEYCGGANDVGTGVAEDTIKTNLLRRWHHSQSNGFFTIAFTIPESSGFTNDFTKQTVRTNVNTWMRSLAGVAFNKLVDLDAQFPSVGEISVDGIHFNAEIHNRIAERKCAALGGDTNAMPPWDNTGLVLDLNPHAERSGKSDGDIVASLHDQTGNLNTFTNPASGKQPFWTNNPIRAAGQTWGYYAHGVAFDGVDNFLQSSNNFDLSGTNKITIYLKTRAFEGGTGVLLEHSVDGVTTAGGCLMYVSGFGFEGYIYDGSNLNRTRPSTGVNAANTVITLVIDTSQAGTADILAWINGNGTGNASDLTDLSHNLASHKTWLASRTGSASFGKFQILRALVFKGAHSTARHQQTELYLEPCPP